MQNEFWTAFKEYADSTGTKMKVKKPYPQNFMSFGIGRTGIDLWVVGARGDPAGLKPHHHLRVEIVTSGANREAFYEQLEPKQGEIESKLGTSLTWARPAYRRQGRIYVSKDADVTDPDDWPDQHQWLLTWLQKFDDVFRPLVEDLEP